MNRIINHLTDDDLYKFTMGCAVIDNYPRAQVKYEFTDRSGRVYPSGFATELRTQIDALADLELTADEADFFVRRCPYIPAWYLTFLKGFRYDPRRVAVEQDCDGHLHIHIEGPWSETILLEVKILAIVSELYFIMTGERAGMDMDDFVVRSRAKGLRMIGAGCYFSDFGTRRRASFEAQDLLVATMKSAGGEVDGPGCFTGTSNVYLAMKHDLKPIGTMAHELVCAIAAMFGPQMANHLAMQAWSATFRGALGTFLYDTYGWNIFSMNFSEDYANMFKGLRVDSGDNLEQLRLITGKYRSLGIDPSTKQVVFSNALDVDRAIEIQKVAASQCIPSFGIGTHFTCDFPGVKPLNIVIKLLAAKITEKWDFYNETCKLSEDHGKYTGNPEVVKRFLETLHID